jgi:hypothetical protein
MLSSIKCTTSQICNVPTKLQRQLSSSQAQRQRLCQCVATRQPPQRRPRPWHVRSLAEHARDTPALRCGVTVLEQRHKAALVVVVGQPDKHDAEHTTRVARVCALRKRVPPCVLDAETKKLFDVPADARKHVLGVPVTRRHRARALCPTPGHCDRRRRFRLYRHNPATRARDERHLCVLRRHAAVSVHRLQQRVLFGRLCRPSDQVRGM